MVLRMFGVGPGARPRESAQRGTPLGRLKTCAGARCAIDLGPLQLHWENDSTGPTPEDFSEESAAAPQAPQKKMDFLKSSEKALLF